MDNELRTDKSVLDNELAWASQRPSSLWSSNEPPSSTQNDVFYSVLSVDEQKRLSQYSKMYPGGVYSLTQNPEVTCMSSNGQATWSRTIRLRGLSCGVLLLLLLLLLRCCCCCCCCGCCCCWGGWWCYILNVFMFMSLWEFRSFVCCWFCLVQFTWTLGYILNTVDGFGIWKWTYVFYFVVLES